MTMIPNGLDRLSSRLPGTAGRDPAPPPCVRVPAERHHRGRSNINDAIPALRITRRPSQPALGCFAARSIQIAIARMSPALLP